MLDAHCSKLRQFGPTNRYNRLIKNLIFDVIVQLTSDFDSNVKFGFQSMANHDFGLILIHFLFKLGHFQLKIDQF